MHMRLVKGPRFELLFPIVQVSDGVVARYVGNTKQIIRDEGEAVHFSQNEE